MQQLPFICAVGLGALLGTLGTARAVPGFVQRAPVLSERTVSCLEVLVQGRERGCQTLRPGLNWSPGCILETGAAAEVGKKTCNILLISDFPVVGVEEH